MFSYVSLLLLIAATVSQATNLRGDINIIGDKEQRQLQSYYFSTTDKNILGQPNKRSVLDNPMKGLHTSPRYTGDNTPDTIPSTIDFIYMGLDE